MCVLLCIFFNDTATTEIYTLSLHDALPILDVQLVGADGTEVCRLEDEDDGPPPKVGERDRAPVLVRQLELRGPLAGRSEEHTSELQSRQYLVCRLLLEKKKKN